MDTPIVSIITPCYNQSKYIAEAIDSVISQTFSDWELIVVDDGSVDDSADIVKQYCEKDLRIKYFHQKNSGPSYARNIGVSKSNGKYLFFLDGDDMISSNLLELGIAYMETHLSCAVFYADLYYFGDKQGYTGISYTTYKSLLCKSSVPCCSIIRKLDFERVGGFDENMKGYEDWEFFIRLLYQNEEVHREYKSKYYYRILNTNNSVNIAANKNAKELVMYIYEKHKNKYIELLGSPIYAYQKADYLQIEINKILNSKTYRIGQFLSKPVNFIKSVFHYG